MVCSVQAMSPIHGDTTSGLKSMTDPHEHYRHIIRMGTFHTIIAIFATLEKRLIDVGMCESCIETCLVTQSCLS